MTIEIPASHHDLFTEPIVATFVTLTPDGKPHATIVWCRLNGSQVQIAILNGTQKYKNLQANKDVSVLVIDTNHPYRYIEVRGTAELSISGKDATPIIQDIARKYGRPDFDWQTNEHKRSIVTITPKKVVIHG
ncbi:MAG: PPOX class F420-dependent oxidoreductase [Chloroflexota bacterium]